MAKKSEGPRHRDWRRMRSICKRVLEEVRQFNRDLETVRQNTPGCANLPDEPIAEYWADIPPEPAWED